jgi:phosphoribosylformylglycinamidine cyclo-ligase
MTPSLRYKDAGVDTEKALEMVGGYAQLARRTMARHQLLQSFGSFASALELTGYRQPVILTSCDGVGTKIKPLLAHDLPEYAGVDLVAMSVNDVLTANALPLMFLDYIGVHALDERLIMRLVAGMADALAGCECILAGGETAEMPGLVEPGLVELSGFVVGAAEKDHLLHPETIQPGDPVFGVASAGFHANGWSLIRRVLEAHPGLISDAEMRDLLTPTRIYFPEVMALRRAGLRPRGMAHITGGGIREKFGRILGARGADLTLPRWENELARRICGTLAAEDALHAFNMGVGWMIVVAPEQAETLRTALPEAVALGQVSAEPGIRIALTP